MGQVRLLFFQAFKKAPSPFCEILATRLAEIKQNTAIGQSLIKPETILATYKSPTIDKVT